MYMYMYMCMYICICICICKYERLCERRVLFHRISVEKTQQLTCTVIDFQITSQDDGLLHEKYQNEFDFKSHGQLWLQSWIIPPEDFYFESTDACE